MTSPHTVLSWQEYSHLSPSQRADFFQDKDRRTRNILFTAQFDIPFLEALYKLTDKIKKISESTAGKKFLRTCLEDKRILLYFRQPSTRTYLSFVSACQLLGARTCDVRDTTASSEAKGESLMDSVRTMASYVDAIILRDYDLCFIEQSAHYLHQNKIDLPILNAGAGLREHPTQALLDLYTLRSVYPSPRDIAGKCVVFLGDARDGRAMRSLICILKVYSKVTFLFLLPKGKGKGEAIHNDMKAFLNDQSLEYAVMNDKKKALGEADILYITRHQYEYDSPRSKSPSLHALRYEDLSLLKETCRILHPLPRRDELDPRIDDDPRAMYWQQVKNGLWVRTALMATVFRMEDTLMNYSLT